MTRSAIQFFHGHFLAAFQWNPLVFAALCGLIIFNAYAVIVLVTRASRVRLCFCTQRAKTFVRVSVVSVFALNWIYLLSQWRNF